MRRGEKNYHKGEGRVLKTRTNDPVGHAPGLTGFAGLRSTGSRLSVATRIITLGKPLNTLLRRGLFIGSACIPHKVLNFSLWQFSSLYQSRENNILNPYSKIYRHVQFFFHLLPTHWRTEKLIPDNVSFRPQIIYCDGAISEKKGDGNMKAHGRQRNAWKKPKAAGSCPRCWHLGLRRVCWPTWTTSFFQSRTDEVESGEAGPGREHCKSGWPHRPLDTHVLHKHCSDISSLAIHLLGNLNGN